MKKLYLTFRVIIGLVWFVNGLICKVLNLVPRHEKIVSEILGPDYAVLLTRGIGFGEILLAIWIWTGLYSRLAAILQMVLVLTMNVLEFLQAPELLLWGRLNAFFALLFVIFVGWHEFWQKPRALGPNR
ncbi:MAG: DoxX-like family protein [Verrucomicrobiota bacterium]